MAVVLLPWFCGCGANATSDSLLQLQSDDADQRRAAALALEQVTSAGEEEWSALIAAVGDEDAGVRQAACRALGLISPAAKSAVPTLRTALEDPELSVRLAAAFALLKLDPTSQDYVPVINAAMKQGEGGTIVAVGRLGASAAWALPALTELLRDRRPGIRRISADAIANIGPDAAATAALQKAQKDPDDRVRAAATAALASGR
jgi:HEAT repeat protein